MACKDLFFEFQGDFIELSDLRNNMLKKIYRLKFLICIAVIVKAILFSSILYVAGNILLSIALFASMFVASFTPFFVDRKLLIRKKEVTAIYKFARKRIVAPFLKNLETFNEYSHKKRFSDFILGDNIIKEHNHLKGNSYISFVSGDKKLSLCYVKAKKGKETVFNGIIIKANFPLEKEMLKKEIIKQTRIGETISIISSCKQFASVQFRHKLFYVPLEMGKKVDCILQRHLKLIASIHDYFGSVEKVEDHSYMNFSNTE